MAASGRIVTVCGDIGADKLGNTLTHEHLSMRFDVSFVPPKDNEAGLAKLDWSLKNYGWIHSNRYSHEDNIVLNDAAAESAVLQSVSNFARAGGGCLVENSTRGLYRKTDFLRTVSKKTGVQVVAGTGYYVVAAQDKDTLIQSSEEMADMMTHELIQGCLDEPTIRCGFIGEIGCSWPLHSFERRVIEASAAVQQLEKCAVSFHPGRHPDAPFEIMRIFLEAGGKADKTIMSHLERTIVDSATLSEFAKLGTYCQFDLFGIENSYYQLAPEIDYPSDAQRMDYMVHLVKEKCGDKLLMAQDIHTKDRLEDFGGHGYGHVLKYAVPKLVDQKGLTQGDVNKILIENPARVLAYK